MKPGVDALVRAARGAPATAPWELTELDRANLFLLLRGTWIFDTELDVPKLRAGLAELLDLYPHLGGRMVRGAAIDLNNAGVPFTVAENSELSVKDVVAEALDNRLIDTFSTPISKSRVKKGRQAPLSVRVTRLRDGSVLGVRCSHACLDGNSFYTMANTWSRICSGRPHPTPTLEQPLVPPVTQRSKTEVKQAMADAGWARLSLWAIAAVLPRHLSGALLKRTPAFHFSSNTLQRLKAAARREAECDSVTTNVALSAHLTRMCARLHELPATTTCNQVTLVDGRERVASVPATFAGNIAFSVNAGPFRADASLGEITGIIHESLGPMVTRPSPTLEQHIVLGRESMVHKLAVAPFDFSAMHCRKPTLTYTNNFSKIPIYDVDFGDETNPVRPVLAVPHDLPDPVLIWPTPPARDGVDVYFAGVAARAVARLDPAAAWWDELRRFDDA